MNSTRISYTLLSPNCSARTADIDTITIHHMAGNLSLQSCGNIFQNPSRQASANYGIDSEGNIGLYVPESHRAWTSANRENDNRAVTIEVANDGGAPHWHVSEKALEALVDLCADICRRNGIRSLRYTGNTKGNLTRHNMFAATTCPGPYLESKFPEIARKVNEKLGEETNKGEFILQMKYLRKGSRGEDVRGLQILLMGRGYSVGNSGADGIFGNDTENALKAYQKKKLLEVDGVAGPESYRALLGVA